MSTTFKPTLPGDPNYEYVSDYEPESPPKITRLSGRSKGNRGLAAYARRLEEEEIRERKSKKGKAKSKGKSKKVGGKKRTKNTKSKHKKTLKKRK